MTSKRQFTIYGNCQAAALATQMLSHAAFARDYAYVPLGPCFLIPDAEIRDWLARHEGQLDLLISQNLQPGWREGNAAWDVETVARSLRSNGRLLRYSDIYFRGVDPMLVYPKTFRRPPHCDYSDLISLTLVALGFADPALAAKIHRDPALLQAHEIEAVRNLAELELQRRESNLEIRCASELATVSRQTPAFHTFNHPRNTGLEVVAKKVLALIGVEAEPTMALNREILSTVHFPLPTSLRAAYPATVVDGGELVRLEDGKDISLEQYFDISFGYLAQYNIADLREELRRQREDAVSGIVICAVERALANRFATSPAVIDEIGKLNTQGITPEFLLTKADPQAVGFMVDVLGQLRSTLLPRHMYQAISVLDLGAKSGAGSQLMGFLGQSRSFSKVKFAVTCADIDPTYQAYAAAKHPDIEYLNADVFEAGRQWDVVICSHVIEHVPDPKGFVHRLRSIARQYVVLAFPFLEDPDHLIPGHLHSLGHDFLRELGPSSYQIYDGLFWTQSLCAIAVLDMNNR